MVVWRGVECFRAIRQHAASVCSCGAPAHMSVPQVYAGTVIRQMDSCTCTDCMHHCPSLYSQLDTCVHLRCTLSQLSQKLFKPPQQKCVHAGRETLFEEDLEEGEVEAELAPLAAQAAHVAGRAGRVSAAVAAYQVHHIYLLCAHAEPFV